MNIHPMMMSMLPRWETYVRVAARDKGEDPPWVVAYGHTNAYKLGGPFELPPGQPPSDKVEAKVSSLEMLRTQKIELRLANDKLEAITCAFERFSN